MIFSRAVGLLLVGAILSSALLAGEPTGTLARFGASRTWTDSTGMFKIDGKMQSADDNGVELLKADGLVIKLPLDKLSTPDQAFVKQFLAAEKAAASSPSNPFAGGAPASPFAGGTPVSNREEMSSPPGAFGDAPESSPGAIRQVRAIEAGVRTLNASPKEPFWKVPKPIVLPDIEIPSVAMDTPLKKEFFDSIRVLAAGRAPLVVLNTYRQSRKAEENHSSFLVMHASKQVNSQVASFNEPWKLMAMVPNGATFAAVRVVGFDKGNDLAIFKVEAGEIRPLFEFTAGGGSWDELSWVSFLPNNRLAAITQKHTLTIWDLANPTGPKAIYRGSTGNASKAEMTPAGELMAFPVGKNIAVVDTSNGQMVGYLAREIAPEEIAFSPDGRHLAVFHAFTVSLYSMEDASELKTFAVSASSASGKFQWAGKYLMVGDVVYDVEREMPIWTYQRPGAHTIHANLMVGGIGEKTGSTIVVQNLPHDDAIRAAENVDPKAIYALVPGDRVRVTMNVSDAPANVQQEIQASVQAKIAELGWIEANDANTLIEITLKRGEQDSVEYYTRRGFGPIFAPPGFGGPPSGPAEKVTFHPWTHSVAISSGGTALFNAGYTRSAPQNLQTKEGESTQAAVSKYTQPDPKYFVNVKIPPYLLKAEYRDGLGKSRVTAKGLE
ncbi:MAG: SHD1 domain-containing protein [Pirellulaceae bacterium]